VESRYPFRPVSLANSPTVTHVANCRGDKILPKCSSARAIKPTIAMEFFQICQFVLCVKRPGGHFQNLGQLVEQLFHGHMPDCNPWNNYGEPTYRVDGGTHAEAWCGTGGTDDRGIQPDRPAAPVDVIKEPPVIRTPCGQRTRGMDSSIGFPGSALPAPRGWR